ncbi:MAG: ATP/GTP-binding protein [Candidatus Hadarchaeales archaeon]
MPSLIYLMGPAGCGKSTLTSALHDAISAQELDSITINLDPGVEWLPYTPDIDIRTYVSLSDVMKEFRLGPNGALIVAVDLVVNHLPEIREMVEKWNVDYVIVDTPGQMELFAFRETGPAVVESLSPAGDSMVLFLIDSFFAKNPSSFVSMLMLASSVIARFRRPQLNVLTKSDAVEPAVLERTAGWMEKKSMLLEALMEEPNPLERETAIGILESIEKMSFSGELLAVSATHNSGIVELLAAIERALGKERELDVQKETEIL